MAPNVLYPRMMGGPGGFMPPQVPQMPPSPPMPPALSQPEMAASQGRSRMSGFFGDLLAPEVALPMAGAMMMGDTPGQSFGGALTLAGQGLGAQRERREAKQEKNKTRAWLLQQGLSDADADAAMSNPAILSHYLKAAKGGGNGPASVQEWEYFNSLSPEDQARYLRMKRATPYLDLGTHFASPDPTRPGEIAGAPIVKENYQEKFDQAAGGAAGKAQGEARATYDSMMSKMPGLEYTVSELDRLANTATYTIGGQLIDQAMKQAGMEPREAAVARAQYTAIVANQILPLLRDTFGAQFTAEEGERLLATLGDPNMSPQEKQAVLKAFIEQKRRDIEALARQTGQAPAAPSSPQRLRFNPATGELE